MSLNLTWHSRELTLRRSAPLVLALALTALSPGCALRQTVDDLQAQNEELQRKNFELRKELAEARLRASVGGSTARAGASSREAAPRSGDPAPDRGDPEAAGASEAVPSGPGPGAGVVYSEPITEIPAAPAGSSAASGAAAELMRSAKGRLDAKDPEAALAAFREIVARHPQDALADDAQFGAGECYFAMGRFLEAISEYRGVIERFPYGDQVPLAFLKIGFSHLALEQRDQALDNFKTVSQAYPGTEAATVARQQIAHMKAARP